MRPLRRPLRIREFLTIAVISSAAASLVQAQTIDGQLVDAISGKAIPRAFVILRDSSGSEVSRVLTDGRGRFTIEAPRAGWYRLQTAIIGWRSWTSPALQLQEGETFEYRMAAKLNAVRLDAILVEGQRECKIHPDSGLAVARVWEEARKALAAVAWTQRSDSLWYQAIEYDRRLHPETLASMGGRARRFSGVAASSPFKSLPAQELSATGYIRRNEHGEWEHFGPDADVLLSPTFAADHCFFLRSRPDDPSMLGLAFQPIRTKALPDIRGVMWLERDSARLRVMEFEYDQLPWPIYPPHLGGRIEFEQTPGGLWIVSRWQLRMPEVVEWQRQGRLSQYRITAYQETGGFILQLRHADGSPLESVRSEVLTGLVEPNDATAREPPRSGVTGRVWDTGTGEPVVGAAAFLLDTDGTIRAVAVTDSLGSFAVAAPGLGNYGLWIRRIGYDPTGSDSLDVPARGLLEVQVNIRPSGGEPPSIGTAQTTAVAPYRYGRLLLEETGSLTVFELALAVTGAHALGTPDQPILVLNSYQCSPVVFVDGHATSASRVLHLPMLPWLQLVEISPTMSEIPEPYRPSDPALARCGAILIWTAGGEGSL